MERTKKLAVILLSLIVALSFMSTPVFAADEPAFEIPEIMMLSAPEKQQRRFDINGPFDLWTLSNIVIPHIIICTGDADDLTITLSLHSSLASKDYLDFMAIVAGISMTSAIFEMDSITTPYSISMTIPIDTTFAAMVLVTAITSISDGIEEAGEAAFPLEFTVVYDLTETVAAAE